jgi:hypothetical protein
MFEKMKLALSRTFRYKGRDVKGEVYHKDGTTGFNVKISNPSAQFSHMDLLAPAPDTVECKVFGTVVTSCDLEPKLPACTFCPLNT